MARIIPSDLTRLALAGAHGPEIATLAHLRDALPEDYTVFHSVHWTRQYRGHTLYGEIDFVILNRAGQVLCIEQKNGPLEESQGEGQTFEVVPDVHTHIDAQERAIAEPRQFFVLLRAT